MPVNPLVISPAAYKKEQELEHDFFKLLYIADKKQEFASCIISPIEWRMAADCLDQINYRYADFYGLLTFAVAYPMRNRVAAGWFARYRFPIYLSLVGYDCGLRSISQHPAITYWNSVSVLDSDLSEIARTLNTPEAFYEVSDKSREPRPLRPLTFFSWLGDSLIFVSESFLLQRLLSHTLEGSTWQEKLSDKTVMSSLVVNSRFFKWRLFDLRLTYEHERVVYDMDASLMPSFGFSRNMRRSFRCRKLIMERSSAGGRFWYGANFTLMRLFGIEKY